MSILNGQNADESDFIDRNEADADPTNDAGRVPKLEADGKLHRHFLPVKFGGDGSDGALAISSGTTTLDLGGVKVFERNYTSISITGTGALAFSNPHNEGTIIILRSLGDVTITSSATAAIDTRGMGAAGGAGTNGSSASTGTDPHGRFITSNPMAGGAGADSDTGDDGAQVDHPYLYTLSADYLHRRVIALIPGAGGGGASGGTGAGNPSGGNGGRGAGALLIECGGALNFTGTINTSGNPGTNGGNSSERSAGGGGGGSASKPVILYNELTANSGTITSAGGTGGDSGTGGSAIGSPGGGGGGAGSLEAAGSAGSGAGGRGGAGSASTPNAGVPGGASMGGVVAQNKYLT